MSGSASDSGLLTRAPRRHHRDGSRSPPRRRQSVVVWRESAGIVSGGCCRWGGEWSICDCWFGPWIKLTAEPRAGPCRGEGLIGCAISTPTTNGECVPKPDICSGIPAQAPDSTHARESTSTLRRLPAILRTENVAPRRPCGIAREGTRKPRPETSVKESPQARLPTGPAVSNPSGACPGDDQGELATVKDR